MKALLQSVFIRCALFAVIFAVIGRRLIFHWDDYPDDYPAPLRWILLQIVMRLLPLSPETVADIEFAATTLTAGAIVGVITALVLWAVKRFVR